MIWVFVIAALPASLFGSRSAARCHAARASEDRPFGTVTPYSTTQCHQAIVCTRILARNSWTKSKKRKAISTAKFYFFDTGVTHALAGTQTLDRNSDLAKQIGPVPFGWLSRQDSIALLHLF